jgi:5-oxoprolinase (ATP-hydrolysing) subunit A
MSAVGIDLNADLGEIPEACAIDDELMRSITSANIACGGHAGDSESVRRAVAVASSLGVNVGAHPSYPDRANFGRVVMQMAPAELRHEVEAQIRRVADAAAHRGVCITHVKPHGALYHTINLDTKVARTVADAVRKVDATMIVVVQYGSPAVTFFREQGLSTATEAFVDRAYEADGMLRSRSLQGALLDEERAIAQALSIVLHHRATAWDGSLLTIAPDTLCLHSDTPNAAAMAKHLRRALEQAGVRMMPVRKAI